MKLACKHSTHTHIHTHTYTGISNETHSNIAAVYKRTEHRESAVSILIITHIACERTHTHIHTHTHTQDETHDSNIAAVYKRTEHRESAVSILIITAV